MLFAIASIALATVAVSPGAVRKLLNVTSTQCGRAPQVPIGELTIRNIQYRDPALGTEVRRQYQVYLPTGYNETVAYPVLLSYHGWGSDWLTFRHGFHLHGDPGRYITVYMSGMGDSPYYSMPSWNVGNAGTLDSCVPETEGTCYDSCRHLNKCSRCNSYTCYDDIEYTKQVLSAVFASACVDESAIVGVGTSNGGQFLYNASVELPVFAGLIPMVGLPFEGHHRVAPVAPGPGLIHFHGDDDWIIPAHGGVSIEGWLYDSVLSVAHQWARVYHCSEHLEPYWTPWDGRDGMHCQIHPCHGSVQEPIVHCILSGGHGVFPGWAYDFVAWSLDRLIGRPA